MEKPFWETKSLQEMSAQEWEALCDGCGKCCLIKLEDEDSGDIVYTDLACHALDLSCMKCTCYETRTQSVPGCIRLEPHDLSPIDFLPSSCAYKRIYEGRSLAAWHPLIAGDQTAMRDAGISAVGRVQAEAKPQAPSYPPSSDLSYVEEDDFEAHVVDWPFHDQD